VKDVRPSTEFTLSAAPALSLHIPRSVEELAIEVMCAFKSLGFESGSRLLRIAARSSKTTFPQSTVVSRRVELLGVSAFMQGQLSLLLFEPDSQGQELRASAIRGCSFPYIMIPKRVRSIHGSAFFDAAAADVTIDPGNDRFALKETFLIHVTDHTLISDFSSSRTSSSRVTSTLLQRAAFANGLCRLSPVAIRT
jgi:hypothetical protein